MGELLIYSHEPRYALPPQWKEDIERLKKGLPTDLKIPTSRAECIRDIQAARDANSRLPWLPYNCTNPLIDDEESTGEHYVDCIGTASVSYASVNAPGVFKAKLHPNSYYPAVGWYISAFWSTEEDTGKLMFYGRVTGCRRTSSSIEITATDVLQNLMTRDQVTVNEMTVWEGMYYLTLLSGSYMYQEAPHDDGGKLASWLYARNKMYSTYLDGVKDLLELLYIVTLRRQYIRADGGIVVLCSYTNPDTIDIIDTDMMPPDAWEFNQSTDKTYTSAAISYPVMVSPREAGNSSGTTLTNYHLGTSWNMRFRYAQGLPYTASVQAPLPAGRQFSANDANSSALQMANMIANQVLQYHGYPTYTLGLRNVNGITRLQAGMLIGVPFTLGKEPTKYIAICVIQSITHSFNNGEYTMDITAELDPYDQTIRPTVEMNADEIMELAQWNEPFNVVSHDLTKDLPVRMPLWLRATMGLPETGHVPGAKEAEPSPEVASEMQGHIVVAWKCGLWEFSDIKVGTTGAVVDKKGDEVRDTQSPGEHKEAPRAVIPATPYAGVLDSEKRTDDPMYRAQGVMIRRKDITTVYLMYCKKGERLGTATAGVVMNMEGDHMLVMTKSGKTRWNVGRGRKEFEKGDKVVHIESPMLGLSMTVMYDDT